MRLPGLPPVEVVRRRPRWSEIRQNIQFRSVSRDRVQRRLDNALTIDDLRKIARRTTPRSVFDYVDGAAESEITAERNVQAYRGLTFHPDALRAVADPDLEVELLGRTWSLPLGFGATGYTRMMHHHGEAAVARVAQAVGIPYGLSTVGNSTVEQVRAAAPEVDLWFQLYPTSQEINAELIRRAANAGCSTIVLTCDTAVSGKRFRDDRNGLTIPPTLRPSTIADMAQHPYWWVNKLTTEQVSFASLMFLESKYKFNEIADRVFDSNLSLESLDWIRDSWRGTLLVKGILSVDGAVAAVEHGADGVVLSNHGGRQLDRTPAPITLVPEVRAALGDRVPILVDSGIRNGQDIVAARALGADAALVGRAYLYGIMAGGQDGVVRAYEILAEEYRRAMQLLGVRRSVDLAPRHVSLGRWR
ncbi:alpha-hydroxy-acid oxidizing protein [Microlunatus elymi]|uniref:Alpha-hydroxy-acid oxidizing protein n=1 Tax=Microlunatus elymi TaxID=2596828 RepID=A0A516Q224_9ACTN|nr:alpha-hydroxy acid oxidase [Microlunatus elymi]QDP97432.1 alpha-hydroxy-acid oxidizing protein [Microlunatus elymi]